MKTTADGLLFIQTLDNKVRIGLTAQAQEDLGKVTFVNLPKIGAEFKKGDSLVEVEAEKAVNEFVAPIAGTITAVHQEASDQPELLDNPEAFSAWLVEMIPAAQ
ncbi:glycine cleavage system protein H [Enterococcus timonensis]|uniref:glycine cleavage system protein H n=1 Tax=Enterococcus timonensis TaxID=1852364 RepID=UPI0008D99812|nr:glycine cleavage system protein H [Enterococcus timonensis]